MTDTKIPIGISACLMGDEVRYNGGHKRSRICLNQLSSIFEYAPFCPEVAVGLGIPREAIHIIDKDGAQRVVGTKTDTIDVTDELYEYGKMIGEQSKAFSGYVLMKNSPSCGLYSAKVYRGQSPLPGKHAGMFVRGLQTVNPLLPLEEEGRLNDPVLRENFVAWVGAYHDWRMNIAPEPTPKALVDFHSRYKYQIMSHSQKAYKALGRIVAEAGKPGFTERVENYISTLMETFKKPATRRGHVNTLQHIVGYLRDNVEPDIRKELNDLIESYRLGHVNLSVPATMLNHYLRRYGSAYINAQVYLNPYSDELGLRNAI